MKNVKATKTERYSQSQPHLPQKLLVEGKQYALPDKLADRVVELGGGEFVEDKAGQNQEEQLSTNETPEDSNQDSEKKVETAEEQKTYNQRETKFGRKAGQKRN